MHERKAKNKISENEKKKKKVSAKWKKTAKIKGTQNIVSEKKIQTKMKHTNAKRQRIYVFVPLKLCFPNQKRKLMFSFKCNLQTTQGTYNEHARERKTAIFIADVSLQRCTLSSGWRTKTINLI